ncbi:outer membrane porin GjpA [Mycobacterium sp. M1]|uniref:Outer membrane porin GjpA n=1 Tax=Mycolicibacter acidiphilus TaxID=2835306 RepID=A0ABS5RIM2_9MYCO|nr:outer membrane porin GjpA [Mycolicibacter acidiphilus]MBS9534145.1 outer membrane porin GjpA [Mycolicibacter acidiphilus]
MHEALRPYVTAGVTVLGASMIAITPIAATSAVGLHAMPDVALTAGADLGDINFTQAWTDAFDTAKENATALQTAAKDASSALSDALKTVDFKDLDFKQLGDALTFLGGDQKNFIDHLVPQTLGNNHALMFDVITDPAGTLTGGTPVLPDDILPIVNFLASPLSGQIFGALGPSISPLVALFNSFEAISADLSTADGHVADATAALQEMVNIPANMLNGFLNGSTLDLDALVPELAKLDLPLPAGLSIDHLSLGFGGLLSPGDVIGTLGDETTPSAIGSVGGSIFNGLGVGLAGVPVLGTLDLTPHGVGPLAASTMIENFLSQWLSGDLPALTAPDTTSGSSEAVDGLSALLGGFDLSSIGL